MSEFPSPLELAIARNDERRRSRSWTAFASLAGGVMTGEEEAEEASFLLRAFFEDDADTDGPRAVRVEEEFARLHDRIVAIAKSEVVVILTKEFGSSGPAFKGATDRVLAALPHPVFNDDTISIVDPATNLVCIVQRARHRFDKGVLYVMLYRRVSPGLWQDLLFDWY